MALATPSADFDVIIIGSRPAGSTLAVRLGRHGLRVLLLDRAVFPSPHPASSPIIYASAMALLDEIGAVEQDYARNTPPIKRWVNEIHDKFRVIVPVPEAFGRDYGYAIDRAHFDQVLWSMAKNLPSVSVRQPFAVTDLLWRDGNVVGIQGQAPGGPIETFHSDCVVGADGRFSTVALKVKAQIQHASTETPTTVYYAAWQNVEPIDNLGAVMHFCKPGRGYFFLLFDTADGLVNVAIEGKTGLLSPEPGQVEAFYLEMLRSHPMVWRRLRTAKMVSPVRGMRNVGNLYRAASGPGWVLVGDAVHQKDPIDGQGIYDALFSARALAQAIISWKQGANWEQAMGDYERAVRAETFDMYNATLAQVKLTVYSEIPVWMDKFLYQWFGADEEVNRRYALLSVRSLPARNWLPAGVLLRAAVRGAFENVGYFLARRPHPVLIREKPV